MIFINPVLLQRYGKLTQRNQAIGIHFIQWTKGLFILSTKWEKSIQGVRIITAENTNATFKPVLEQVCLITTKTSDNIKCYMTSAYVPKYENTIRNLEA